MKFHVSRLANLGLLKTYAADNLRFKEFGSMVTVGWSTSLLFGRRLESRSFEGPSPWLRALWQGRLEGHGEVGTESRDSQGPSRCTKVIPRKQTS